VVICLERGTNDLHMVQLMPLPTCHLLLQQNPEWFILLVRPTQVVMEKRPLNVCVCVCVFSFRKMKTISFSFSFSSSYRNSIPAECTEHSLPARRPWQRNVFVKYNWVITKVHVITKVDVQLRCCALPAFYRASYALHSICHGPVSVCVSVCVCLSQVGVLLKQLNVG